MNCFPLFQPQTTWTKIWSWEPVCFLYQPPPREVSANVEPTSDTLLVTFDPEELLASGDIGRDASEAIRESEKLTKSGPEDVLYVFIFAAILYYNRRKIAGVLS
jgi:hypothetical protein